MVIAACRLQAARGDHGAVSGAPGQGPPEQTIMLLAPTVQSPFTFHSLPYHSTANRDHNQLFSTSNPLLQRNGQSCAY